MKKFKLFLFSFLLICSQIVPMHASNSAIENTKYSNIESFGPVLEQGVLRTGIIGEHRDKLYAYGLVDGGYFNVIDIDQNELVYSKLLENVNSSWAHTLDHKNNPIMVSLGKNGLSEVWKYNWQSEELELVTVLPKEEGGWSVTTDDIGNIYVGTYSDVVGEAKVFKYEVESENLISLGIMNKGSTYVRSLAYHDNYIYAGAGVNADIFRYDLVNNKWEDITQNMPEIAGKDINDLKFAYDMAVVDDLLVTRVDKGGSDITVFYDLVEQQWLDFKLGKTEEHSGTGGFNQLYSFNDHIYLGYGDQLVGVNPREQSIIETNVPMTLGLKGALIKGNKFYTLDKLTNVVEVNLDTHEYEYKEDQMRGGNLGLHSIGTSNSGDIFITSYPGGPKAARFNIKDESFDIYNQGQAEGMIAGHGDDMYFGIYTGAVIEKLNSKTLEQEVLFNLKDSYGQDRPYYMDFISEEDLLMMGTIPDYKILGGVIALYNVKTDELSVYENVVENQSIVSLAKKGQKLFGSTAIEGGLGIDPIAEKAVIFEFDITSGEVISSVELDIPELDKPRIISGLTFDENGLLWGVVDGILFTFDTEKMQVVDYKNIFPEKVNYGKWKPFFLDFGPDGFLYTNIGSQIVVVDQYSDNWEHKVLTDQDLDSVGFMTFSQTNDGSDAIYFTSERDKYSLHRIVIEHDFVNEPIEIDDKEDETDDKEIETEQPKEEINEPQADLDEKQTGNGKEHASGVLPATGMGHSSISMIGSLIGMSGLVLIKKKKR